LHLTQVSEHARSQQTLSTQKPVRQAASSVQSDPLERLASQVKPLQKKPAAHSSPLVQAVRHASPAASHAYAPQLLCSALAQVPDPSQDCAGEWTPETQDSARQLVSAEWSAQAPAPSQSPVSPQESAGEAAQS
jgi:broad specificity phosphatase PhoE